MPSETPKHQDSCGFAMLANIEAVATESIIEKSLQGLSKLSHRGAVAEDGKSSDGCGILFRQDRKSILKLLDNAASSNLDKFAVAVIYLSPRHEDYNETYKIFNQELEKEQLGIFANREVPIRPEFCGYQALRDLPKIIQVFIDLDNLKSYSDKFIEAKLMLVRKRVEEWHRLNNKTPNFYCASFSSQSISYKAMVTTDNLANFYPDLKEHHLKTSVCLFHQRFSTNTQPQWRLAQPFRYIAHNGEFNTIDGNRNWAQAKKLTFISENTKDLSELQELINQTGSDSMSFDNMLELLYLGGLDLVTAIKLLIPPAYENNYKYDEKLGAMYEYYSLFMEAWDGPAAIVAFDKEYAVCSLDRNGLRPARYTITDNNEFLIGSEIGIIDYDLDHIKEDGKLSPGETIALDFKAKEIIKNRGLERNLVVKHDYQLLTEQGLKTIINPISLKTEKDYFQEEFKDIDEKTYYKFFQVSLEELNYVFPPLASNSSEAIGSMGDDATIAALSSKKRSLYDYFKQRFAQVTNPAIDSIREKNVMSLNCYIGEIKNIFTDFGKTQFKLKLKSPVIDKKKYDEILSHKKSKYYSLDLNIPLTETIENALEKLQNLVEDQIRSGKDLIILSDKAIKERHYLLHPLLALSSLNYYLISIGLRAKVNIILETALARDTHQFAVLLSYGATAIYPYLSYKIIENLYRDEKSQDIEFKLRNYQYAIEQGILKIMSKMGISSLNSYRGSALFDIFGLSNEFSEKIFKKNPSLIGGISISDYENELKDISKEAWNTSIEISHAGIIKYHPEDGESHSFSPEIVIHLQKAVRNKSREEYRKFAKYVNQRNIVSIRDLYTLKKDLEPISIDEVESKENIFKRFSVSAMSLGAISPEAHEAIAVAMNSLGAKSNSGEGGEDPSRFNTNKNSKIKQIASGRFGINAEYLINAEMLQIKIAQGAKPGEGGQLPGFKVNELIAKLRYTTVGTTLISPPPHHDIYSIEDLAQLIFDLKQINPKAEISVKLVASSNVATVACGVAKSYADSICIAGADGGTGASPLSSIKHAGLSWEYGLAETHKLLLDNDLRKKISLQVDGGLKTGLDIVKAAIWGAELYGFGTSVLVSLGCKYLRICHLNNCATGVATQNEELRSNHFKGLSEHIINYMNFVAEEIQEILASLGFRSLGEIVGRTDLLELKATLTEKQKQINISQHFAYLEKNNPVCYESPNKINSPQDKSLLALEINKYIDEKIDFQNYIELNYPIKNTDRSIGALLTYNLLKEHNQDLLNSKKIRLNFKGFAGQSFAAFITKEIEMHLEGYANDYVGKSLSGGKIIIKQSSSKSNISRQSYLLGNTCLYGASSGSLFASGRAGERFGIRNCGAKAVIEGLGDHGCEYMTGGLIVVLGEIGNNFGAGMTGGIALVLDQNNQIESKINSNFVETSKLSDSNSFDLEETLKKLLNEFCVVTESTWGQYVYANFEELKDSFVIVKSYNSKLEELIGHETLSISEHKKSRA